MKDTNDIKKIIEPYRDRKGALIPLLQEIQETYGYVPEESVNLISEEMGIYPVEIYGILTFYAQFHLTPRGRHTIKVCQGTACYIMGGKDILDHMTTKLGIDVDETTEDERFTLERVACLGCCGMAPVVMIDNDFYGRCTVQQADDVLGKYE